MNLIEKMMEECVLMDKVRTADGEGGYTTAWTEGATILAAVTNDTSMASRVAEKEGVTSTYTITTKRANALDFHDVLKRKSDGKIFRVTSDGNDKKSPSASGLDMSQVTAEKWSLT